MNCWILQSNPNKYRWFDAMREQWNKPDTWSSAYIFRYVDEIKPQDISYIWLSNEYEPKTETIYNPQAKKFEKVLDERKLTSKVKRHRGIYAMAEVTGVPDPNRGRFNWEYKYWIDKQERDRLSQYPRLEIKYTNAELINNPILKDELEAAGLGNLLIFRMPRRGIFKLAEEECESIMKLVKKR
ncbi:MAG: EVE domain-containing protein [Dehalococcoidia bacterium]|nr:EVE domain-containing protein [Dehalococcoidia bacterium]MBL7125057.1 EVE domain-containing protein [Dehalococcoidales bacterium]